MGFNTTAFILNDQLDQIQADPAKFVDALVHRICGDDRARVPGQVTVMPTAHMDTFRLYATQCNGIYELSPYARDTVELAARNPAMRQLVLGLVGEAEANLRQLRKTIGSETP